MLWKFLVVAFLALGVFGRSTVDVPDNSPFDEYSQRVIREYCNATHAEDKTSEIKSAMIAFAKCLNGVINFETFAKEMEKAESSEVYDEVIQKYCAIAPQLKECASRLIKGMAPCLPVGLDRTAVNSTNALIDFVCDNNGARITSFIKKDGPRCIRDKMFYIAYCQDAITSNLTKFTKGSGDGISAIARSLYTIPKKDRCVLVDQSLQCLVDVIKSCPNPTIGKLGQEFHNVYLESLSCSKVTQHANTGAVAGTEGTAVDTTTGNDVGKDIDQLKKIKLELEVRIAELEIWKRENELNVRHTVLTSDVKTKGH
ncbi:27 kDa hemolymph glycoprotein-like [Cydia strobilella]|uniref:27 kDa hemolymph glycoprotein-like n=1 Tax=Cydia strobilella TaxID=1100964 RepID=UPI0030078169